MHSSRFSHTFLLLVATVIACGHVASAVVLAPHDNSNNNYSPLTRDEAAAAIPQFMRGRPRGGLMNYAMPKSVGDALPPNVEENWVTQQIDNFNPQDTRTYQARYFVNSQYWDKTNGPIFVMLGGESATDPVWAVECNMVENAKLLKGLVILTEHRFYGKSQPFTDLSTDNLQYLSSEQALADYANLIDDVRTTFGATDANPVVAFGGSYSGALAAWLRLKYPSHVIGAIATSSPVYAELDFEQYLQVVTNSMGTTSVGGSGQCVGAIANGVSEIKKMLSSSAGRSKLGSMFNTCDDLGQGTDLDVTNFMSNTIGLFMGVVQYNLDNRAFEGATNTNVTIEVLCDLMTTPNSDALQQWAKINTLLSGGQCTSFNYTKMIMALRETSLTAPAAEGGRQWTYQTCAEFGFYQTTDSKYQAFGDFLPLDFSIQQCEDIFGSMFTQDFIQGRVNFTLAHYGGLDLLGTNIVIPAGSIDPWHALEVLTPNPAYNISTIFIEGGAHCSNMYPRRASDLPTVLAARKQIHDTLVDWTSA